MRRRDPARTGHAPNRVGPTADPEVRWQATLSDDHPTRTGLVGGNDTVYVASDRAIRAFDAATGERDWRRSRLGTLPWSEEPLWMETAPILDDERLLVGAVSLYALDRTDGQARWEYETNSSLDSTLRAGNTVYVSSTIGAGERLAAIDVRSGLERWKTPPGTGKTPSGTGVHPSAHANGYVVGRAIGREGSFRAVDAATGATEWTRDLRFGRGRRSGPCIAGDTVYCGTGPLYALNLDDGTTRWSQSLGTTDAEVLPVSDGSKVYLALGETGRVLALDADTGDPSWSVDIPEVVGGSAPALVDGTLYVGLERGVVALDASSGEERFRVRKPETANLTNSPVVIDGTLYVVLDRTLYALGES